MGAWLPTRFLGASLRPAATFCWILFGAAVVIDVTVFFLALLGPKRIGPTRLSLASAANAALELRDALGG